MKHEQKEPVSLEYLKRRIEDVLPGAKVQVLDPRNDGTHLKAVVIYSGFKGKSLIEQHRMVYKALEEEFKGALHALSLETRSG